MSRRRPSTGRGRTASRSTTRSFPPEFEKRHFQSYHCIFTRILRSVNLWIKGCVKSRAFLLRRRACFPSPSAHRFIHKYLQLSSVICAFLRVNVIMLPPIHRQRNPVLNRVYFRVYKNTFMFEKRRVNCRIYWKLNPLYNAYNWAIL